MLTQIVKRTCYDPAEYVKKFTADLIKDYDGRWRFIKIVDRQA